MTKLFFVVLSFWIAFNDITFFDLQLVFSLLEAKAALVAFLHLRNLVFMVA